MAGKISCLKNYATKPLGILIPELEEVVDDFDERGFYFHFQGEVLTLNGSELNDIILLNDNWIQGLLLDNGITIKEASNQENDISRPESPSMPSRMGPSPAKVKNKNDLDPKMKMLLSVLSELKEKKTLALDEINKKNIENLKENFPDLQEPIEEIQSKKQFQVGNDFIPLLSEFHEHYDLLRDKAPIKLIYN